VADELRDRLRRFLEEHSTLVLATSADDAPWSSALFYASDTELNVYFVSGPESRHAANIRSNARAAAAINAQHEDWRAIRGIQLEGQAQRLNDPAERDAAIDLYGRRFGWLESLSKTPTSAEEQRIAARLAASNVYRVTPTLMRLVDNARGFGHQDELVLGSD
jgi:uncharacterized protein YhbP (UPF0306 family)